MNIFVNCTHKNIVKKLFFLNNYILYDEINDLLLFNYIITDNYLLLNKIDNLINLEKIFINNFTDPKLLNKKIILVDNNFQSNYLENNILISEYENYTIIKNKLYKLQNLNLTKILFLNRFLYINHSFLEKYKYNPKNIDLNNNIKIIKIINTKNKIDYGLVENNNNFYININNKYKLIDINHIKYNLPIDFEYIYVEDKDNKYISNDKDFINLKINMIFFINEDNLNESFYNINFILNNKYDNYNIIVFLNFETDIFNNLNIYILKNNIKKSNISILLYITKICENNSLIIIIDKNILLNDTFSLEYINLIFIAKKLVVSDFFNLFIFKKELLFIIQNYEIFKILENFNDNYLIILFSYFKILSNNNSYLKNFNLDYNFKEDIFLLDNYEIIFDKNIYYYFENNQEDMINNYLINFDNYEKGKIYFLDYNINSNINNNIIENNLDFTINLYHNNKINYKEFEMNYLKSIFFDYIFCCFHINAQ